MKEILWRFLVHAFFKFVVSTLCDQICQNLLFMHALSKNDFHHQSITPSMKYRIAQLFGGVKLWQIDRFRVLVRENVGEFTIANIATLVNLEFGGVKYWRMVFGLPNPPIFSSAK